MAAESVELHSSQLYPKLDTRQEQSLASKTNNRWQIGFKILELVLCFTCLSSTFDSYMGLFYHSELIYDIPRWYSVVCFTTFGSFFVLSLAFLIGKSIGNESSWKHTDSLSSWIAIVLFIVCAYALYQTGLYHARRIGMHQLGFQSELQVVIVPIILSVITAVVYLTEFFQIKNRL